MQKRKAKAEKPAPVPQAPDHVTPFLARWANAVAVLNALDDEMQAIRKLANDAESIGIGPFLEIDLNRIHGIALALNNLASEALAPPFLGSMDYIGQEQRRGRILDELMKQAFPRKPAAGEKGKVPA